MRSTFAPVDEQSYLAAPHRRRYTRLDLTDHLGASGPKRILSLDGGGVRTAISIAVLSKIEKLLRERHGNHRGFRLCDYFDLVGGSSTGAIVAALVAASNFTVADIRDAFSDLVRDVYGQNFWRLGGRLHPEFDGGKLQRRLEGIFGTGRLGDDRIATGLAILTRRVDRDETCLFHNHPSGPQFSEQSDGSVGHRDLPLARVLRAATGVPARFAPELVSVAEGANAPPGLFVDGSVTSHNNPALQLYLLSTLPDQGFEWAQGAENIQLVSVGTGALCRRMAASEVRRLPQSHRSRAALDAMIDGADHAGDTMLKLLAKGGATTCDDAPFANFANAQFTETPRLTYQRFQGRLSRDHLLSEYGLGLSSRQLNSVRTMSNPDGLQIAFEIGQAIADKIVTDDAFGANFDLPQHGAPIEGSGNAKTAPQTMPTPILPQAPSVRRGVRTERYAARR